MLYKLREPIVAVRKEFTDAQNARVALPPGAIVKILTSLPSYGLMEAEWNGQRIRVYGEDVASRGTMIEALDSD